MFTNISWYTYTFVVAGSSALYYLYVGIRYYAGDLKGAIEKRKQPQSRPALSEEFTDTPVSVEAVRQDAQDDGPSDEYDDVEQVIERIQKTVNEASQRNADPKELKEYLHLVFQEFPSLKESAFRASINELVASECEKYGAVRLSEDAVDELWENSL